MKKRFFTAMALMLCAALLLCCSSCEVLKNIQQAREREILDAPDAPQMADFYNEALANALREASEVKETVSYSVGKPSVSSETGDADILKKAADTLKKMTMQAGPGRGERELQPADTADTLLKNLKTADYCTGVTQPVTVDNILFMEFRFYEEETKTETDENGNGKETVTLLPVDAAMVDACFGAPAAKEEVLAGFDGLKDYLQVKDYTVEYKDCRMKTVSDLYSDLLESVTFEKKMAVTAQATGVGALARLGDFTVTFDVTKTTAYTFTFPENAE